MKNLKIAQMHWGFPPIIGGVETHLAILLREFIKRGHKVGLLTGAVEGEKEQCTYNEIAVYRTPILDLNWLVKRGLDALEDEITKTYNNFFDKTKPDIIHVHNMHYFSEIHAKILCEMSIQKGIPFILTAHNVWDDILFLKLAREVCWTHIIAVSHFIKKELMGIGHDERKITVVHHGIDTDIFRPDVKPVNILKKFPELKNRRIVFHPARMCMAKGCDVSIKAIRLVKERFPDALLVMAGTKSTIDWELSQEKEIAYFVDMVKAFDLREHVFINVYSLQEMPELYSLAHVCVYPSSVPEPFGLTMLESLASGKPMIVSDTGGMPEIIMDDINGYVIKVKDFDMLAYRIDCLLAKDAIRERLGNTGRQIVRTHYTKEIMTKSYLDIYNRVLSGA
ncbi:glycosyltransferase family 4 protein [Thermodesulfovibrionales bacterium]|nr:glycosyltransferase family 4 protein [Thermodesulfovibrionales bacterium]MCL0086955.1 glycosyltransferase family 4 protein [Thermodesulfovibrionales bacterium]